MSDAEIFARSLLAYKVRELQASGMYIRCEPRNHSPRTWPGAAQGWAWFYDVAGLPPTLAEQGTFIMSHMLNLVASIWREPWDGKYIQPHVVPKSKPKKTVEPRVQPEPVDEPFIADSYDPRDDIFHRYTAVPLSVLRGRTLATLRLARYGRTA